MKKKVQKRELLLQGNEAVVEGALRAGCSFFAGYPITPATEISEILSVRLPQLDGTFIQMEDEIASIGAVIGASLAGAKAMTATSGPGFSLMQENIGFAVIAEVPCVIVNAMRGGPSTGLPTMPSQSDVMQARWGTHGDHPIIALCPSTIRECYDLTIKAFNYSEKFRIPVVLLVDEVVAHMREKITIYEDEDVEIFNRIKPTVPPEWYIPFEDTPKGVPAMANFGDGYRYHVTGLTHDIRGFPTSRPDEIDPFIRRLFRKVSQNFADVQIGEFYQTDDADVTIIAYGCVARSARRAAADGRERGLKVGVLKMNTIWPFMRAQVEKVLRTSKVVIVPEMNMGQMSREVKRVNKGDAKVFTINKVDGKIITPQEILSRIKEVY
ncbi:MAG TPA: 2-oxoacid:acceptor oxidoreductase subunit alpha [Syntrophorhabdaceae bacterium]|nr:2-oxoacid:acceptor oxidoreductase subunit alpha [Syntrophorhabdaceae bacterium]HNT69827.1 2-oxoacid:acceptor oxidoreductase subunit alpha [Syntrophorhabdaceae bacterium]